MNSNEAYTSDEIHPKVETPDPFAARREVLFAEKGDAWDSFKRKTNGLSVKQISQAKGAEFAEKEGKECRRETSGEKKEIGKGLEREMGKSEERWKGEGGGGKGRKLKYETAPFFFCRSESSEALLGFVLLSASRSSCSRERSS